MNFRPCIDLHNGKVKQIVGSSLSDSNAESVVTNFEAEFPSSYYARMYQKDGLKGGHVIKLGPGNDEAAAEALRAYPGGLQVGGGITSENAQKWLDYGADKVIVTSCIFQNGDISWEKLEEITEAVGKENLVLDLSCRKRDGKYLVVIDRWQTFTSLEVSAETLEKLADYCCEFLVHAVDVEGMQQGVEVELVEQLAKWSPIPMTYAGGISSMEDIEVLEKAGQGKLDFTVGSALDIFGGTGLAYQNVVDLCNQ